MANLRLEPPTLTFGERTFTVKGWGGVHTYAYHRLDRVGYCGGKLFFATGGRDFDFRIEGMVAADAAARIAQGMEAGR